MLRLQTKVAVSCDMPDPNSLLIKIARAERFAAALQSVEAREMYQAMAAECRRELDLIEPQALVLKTS